MYIYTPLCRYWKVLYRYVLVFIVPHVDIELEDNKQFISNIPRTPNDKDVVVFQVASCENVSFKGIDKHSEAATQPTLFISTFEKIVYFKRKQFASIWSKLSAFKLHPFSGEAKCKGKLNLSLLKNRWITKKKNKKKKKQKKKLYTTKMNHIQGTTLERSVELIDCWGLTTCQPLCVISFLRFLPEKRATRDSRGNEREGQGRKNSRIESEETEEIKTFPLYPYLLQG